MGDDVLQRFGQRRPDLRLILGWKTGDDPIDRFRRTGRVDGAQDDVARLGSGEGECDALVVAQLADDDHVGIFAQRSA